MIVAMRAITANVSRAVDQRGSRVAILAYDGLALLEFAVACDVFGDLDPLTQRPRYQVHVCGTRPGEVRTGTGLALRVPHGLATAARAGTIVVPPCDDPRGAPEEILRAIRRAHARGAASSRCAPAP